MPKTLSSKNKLRHQAPCVERFWKRPRDQGATINQNLFGKKFCDNRCQLAPRVLVSLQVPPLAFCLADHQHGAVILSDQRDRLFTTEPAYSLNHPREGTANWEQLLPTHTCSTLKRCLKPNWFVWIPQVFTWNTARGLISKLPPSQNWHDWNRYMHLSF